MSWFRPSHSSEQEWTKNLSHLTTSLNLSLWLSVSSAFLFVFQLLSGQTPDDSALQALSLRLFELHKK